MMIYEALDWAQRKLKNTSTSAELDAEVLLSYVMQKSKEWLFANPKSEIRNPKQIQNSKFLKFKTLINRRVKGVPVAYLTNSKGFFGMDFYIDERVLVPRPETEMLVEETLDLLRSMLRSKLRNKKNVTIVDVGTGSGCIAIAIAKNSRRVNIYATDISRDALVVARKNARKHGVDPACSRGGVKFLHGDLLEPIIKKNIKPNIIVANLPYLEPNQVKGDIRHEPREALVAELSSVGGEDGLGCYERLFEQVTRYKLQGHKKDTRLPSLPLRCGQANSKIQKIIIEIDPSQAKGIKNLIKKHLPKARVEIKKDLVGLERVVKISC